VTQFAEYNEPSAVMTTRRVFALLAVAVAGCVQAAVTLTLDDASRQNVRFLAPEFLSVNIDTGAWHRRASRSTRAAACCSYACH
jgi:hypothetical protein